MLVKLIISIILLNTCIEISLSQESETPINYYKTIEDFENGLLEMNNATGIIKAEGENFIQFKRIVQTNNRKSSRELNAIWAIEYNGQLYLHQRYSYELRADLVFIRFEIIGRYCLAILDGTWINLGINSRKDTTSADLKVVGSSTWGRGWMTENGEKKYLMFTDTKNKQISVPYIGYYSPIDLMKRKTAKELANRANFETDGSEFTIEDIVEIFHILNAKPNAVNRH